MPGNAVFFLVKSLQNTEIFRILHSKLLMKILRVSFCSLDHSNVCQHILHSSLLAMQIHECTRKKITLAEKFHPLPVPIVRHQKELLTLYNAKVLTCLLLENGGSIILEQMTSCGEKDDEH